MAATQDDIPTQDPLLATEFASDAGDGGSRHLRRGSAPTRVGRYLIVERIGAGAMGVVYSAYDPELDRKIAVKLLLPDRTSESSQARLLREAQAMAQLSHPNVVAVHDVGVCDDGVFIAMDYVRGETMRAWLHRHEHGWRAVLTMFVQAARGLVAAHDAGLVHRDFKPDNVLVDDRGRAMVTDFGLARVSETSEPMTNDAPQNAVATHEGAIQGTPAYMAPEQFAGRTTDARTDQFSFCVALWEGLYGERPFAGTTLFELAISVGNSKPREPSRGRSVPRWLRRALQRGLATDPSARWPSVEALLAELTRGQTRSRMRTSLLIAGVGAIAVLGSEAWRRAEQARKVTACDQQGAEIAALWPGEQDATQTAVRDAMLATNASYAESSFEKVRVGLDAYARSWQDARTQTCLHRDVELTWTDDVAVRADECLELRRADLSALLHELARADAIVVENAVMAMSGLESVEGCTDASTLVWAPSLPSENRESYQAVRARLASVFALERAGKPADSVAIARTASSEAEALGWMPLQAEARFALGSALEAIGDYEHAEVELVEAYVAAGRSGATAVAESAATELVYVVGVDLGRYDDGLLWGRLAELELVRLGAAEDDLVGAGRLSNLASLHRASGHYDEAKKLHEHALSIVEAALGADHLLVAHTLNNLANVYAVNGELDRALPLHERVLAIRRDALGPEHPEVASSLGNLANVRGGLGEHREAMRLYERALAIYVKALGPDHRNVAGSLSNLAIAHEELGEYPEAKELCERALAIRERKLGPDHPDVGVSLANLGNVLSAMGEYPQAQAAYERALTIRRGAEDPDAATILERLASIHQAKGEHAEAKVLYGRALAIQQRVVGPEQPEVIFALAGLGEVALAERDVHEAARLLEHALAIAEANETSPRTLADIRFALARAYGEIDGRRARAVVLAEQAAEAMRDAGARAADHLVRIEDWLQQHR